MRYIKGQGIGNGSLELGPIDAAVGKYDADDVFLEQREVGLWTYQASDGTTHTMDITEVRDYPTHYQWMGTHSLPAPPDGEITWDVATTPPEEGETFPSNKEKWYVNNNPVLRAYVGDDLVYPLDDGGGGGSGSEATYGPYFSTTNSKCYAGYVGTTRNTGPQQTFSISDTTKNGDTLPADEIQVGDELLIYGNEGVNGDARIIVVTSVSKNGGCFQGEGNQTNQGDGIFTGYAYVVVKRNG